MSERVAIAGSGAVACGLADVAARVCETVLLARSEASARRAGERLEGTDVRVEADPAALGEPTFVIEAVAEDQEVKAAVYARLLPHLGPDAVLATTTSSLSVSALGAASRVPERFVGLHVFHPVRRMELVELVFPAPAGAAVRRRTHDLCAALGKTAVEVPDTPGFVVNRLLFPFLFEAVRLLERTGLEAEAVDRCMTLGAAHPLGPLALLDLVGLDVAVAIGEAIGEDVPARLRALVHEGALGRKSGRGFHEHTRAGARV